MIKAYTNPCSLKNYAPSDGGLLILKKLLGKRLSRLANIENEIAIAERWIQHLSQDKDLILKSFEKFHTLLSPAAYLPDDILREIFMWCLPLDRNPTMSAKEAPMLLTQISSQWRTVALTTPRLWTALHIAVPNPVPAPHSSYDPLTGQRIHPSLVVDRRLRGVAEWLAGSGQLPLSLSLHDPDNSTDAGYGRLFVQIILAYAPRWRALSLQCPPDAVVDIARLAPARVPLLESFHVLSTLRTLNWRNSGVLKAPKLRDVSIYGLLEGFSDSPLKWDQLTHLTMMGGQWLDGSLMMAQIGQILARCTRLRTCTLKLAGGASISRERRVLPPIPLPSLEELCIYEMQAQTPFFFAAIDAPKLRVLEYWFDGTAKSSPSGFSTLLLKVGGNIQRLSTNPATIDAAEFSKGLWACTSLTSLILRTPNHCNNNTYIENRISSTSDILLNAFTRPTGGRYLCPRLDTLECLVGSNYSNAVIVDFITRKQTGDNPKISKLKSVRLAMTRGPAMDVEANLGHVTRTLNIDIRYPPPSYKGPFSPYEGLSLSSDPDPYYQPMDVSM